MSSNPSRTLGPDVAIPLVGFGTYLMAGAEAQVAVRDAIRAGYRHVDTAEVYENEVAVGAGIRKGLESTGLSRKDIFVTTKLWPGNEAWGQVPKTAATTVASLGESLDRLQLDYVDLYLIHAPFDEAQLVDQWRGLITLKEQNKARAIGVSNFNVAHIEAIKAAGLQLPQANQIELHPWSQKPELVDYLNRSGIVPIAYSSLVPLSTWRSAPGQDSAKTEQMRADAQREDSPFKLMARKYGVTEAQVLLRWAVQSGYPVLPKSINPARMRQNADIFSFAIDDVDMAAISAMNRGGGVAWSSGDPTSNS